MDQLNMFREATPPASPPHGTDIYTKANEAFYRAVTGDWANYKWTTVDAKLRDQGFPDDMIECILTAVTVGFNEKHSVLHNWQYKINQWHADGNPPDECADLGERIRADVAKAIAPLAPYATDAQGAA